MALSWETLWMDWARISMMHEESCLLVSSMQCRSKVNPKFQAPCSFIRGFWSLDLGVAITQNSFMCFSPPKWFPFLTPKWSTLFDTQMVNLKGIKRNQNCSLKAKLRHTLVKYRSWCCFQTSASRDSKLRLLHPVYPYDHDLPFSGVGKVTKLPQQASVSILWLQMSTVCLYTTQFLW